ncbi:MAG: alkaline phosphatase [Prevotellaceae bacterium]|jgi:alkaline phosphatase|nr:alkaline phosphatase [Prevotellaceae bacterium]
MKKYVLFILGCALWLVIPLSSCQTQQPASKAPKYVFLFIGDGMGLAQVAATEAYLSAKEGAVGSKNLPFSNFPVIGLATTFSANHYVTCSSAAGTALSTGSKTNNDMLGMAPAGDTLTSITYKLKRAGYKIGIATTVGVDHATPAAFYASSGKRSSYYDIALQLPASNFDFFAGGDFIKPSGKNNDRPDIHHVAAEAGYTIVRDHAAVSGVAEKVILLQAENKGAELPYAIDRTDDDLTLPQITAAAIKFLDNEKGFFAMIEGGKIDWACHSNDGATSIYETIDFANAVQHAIDFYHRHPDETLIIVTADHETGGLALNLEADVDGLLLVDEKTTPYEVDVSTYMDKNARRQERQNRIAGQNRKIGLGWTSNDHTGSPVPVYAIGAGSELFGGKYDNTDIPKRICRAMGVAFQ